MAGCVFCKIIKGEIEAVKIWEDDKFFAFLDIKPLNPGHALLLPKEHVDYIFDTEEPLYSEIFQTAKKLARPVQKAVAAKRMGLVVEGFGVPHVHIHLIPLNKGYEIDPARARPAGKEELEKTAEKIRREISPRSDLGTSLWK